MPWTLLFELPYTFESLLVYPLQRWASQPFRCPVSMITVRLPAIKIRIVPRQGVENVREPFAARVELCRAVLGCAPNPRRPGSCCQQLVVHLWVAGTLVVDDRPGAGTTPAA